MKSKIREALKNKYSNLGFSEKTLDGVAEYLSTTITEEEKINEGLTGVEPILKVFQGEADRLRQAKADAEKAAAELAKPKDEPKKDEPNPMEKILETINALNSKIETLETQTKAKTYSQIVAERLKGKVDEDFYRPLMEDKTFTTEEDVEGFVGKIETIFTKHSQKIADDLLAQSSKPGGGNSTLKKGELSKAEQEAFFNTLKNKN